MSLKTSKSEIVDEIDRCIEMGDDPTNPEKELFYLRGIAVGIRYLVDEMEKRK